jgi:hypothetical protein
LALFEEQPVNKKFDPAPHDKNAETHRDQRADKARDKLEKELKDSFPASDPPSSTQPSKPTDDRN